MACARRATRLATIVATSFSALVAGAATPSVTAPPSTIYTRASLVVAEPVPVVVWNRTITEYRAGIAGLSAQDRARNAEARIRALPDDALTSPLEIVSVTAGELSGLQIFAAGRALVTLVPEDVPPESDVTLEQYAQTAVGRLEDVFQAREEQRRPAVLLKAVGSTLLATALYLGMLFVLQRGSRRSQRSVTRFLNGLLARVTRTDVAPVVGSLVRGLTSLCVVAVFVVLTYAWLSFVLDQFPYSHPLASRLGHWLVGRLADFGVAFQEAVPGLFTAVLILVIARLVVVAVSRFFAGVESNVIYVDWLVPATARTTRVLVSILIWIFAFIFAYPYIPGSDTAAFKGISVLLGIMISLGSAGLINQFMSGLVIVYSRALDIGDYATVGDVTGVVKRVGLLSTRLMTSKEEIVTIPNAVVVAQRVISYTRPGEDIDAQLGITVTIGYDAPWRQVHALLLDAAARTAGIRSEPAPFVLQRALSDFYVEYELRVKFEPRVFRVGVASDLNAAIQDAFNDAGVQIMSPHFESQPAEKVCAPPPAGGSTPSASSGGT